MAFGALAAQAEIAYGVSQTFALGATTSVQAPTLAPALAAFIAVSPNPALSFARINWALGSSSANARLDIYNIRGEHVRGFAVNTASGNIVWNGRSERGAMAPSGLYIAKITAGKFLLRKSIVLCR